MSILSTQGLQDIQSAEDLQKIFVKLGYEDTYGEIDVEDLELTETQASAIYRAFLIGSYEQDSLQVILFELKWNEDHILRQRLQAIAKNLSQRPTLFIVLGTTDYETLSLINVSKKFDAEMRLNSVIKESRISLVNPSIFNLNLLKSLATQERKAKEIYEEQRQKIEYSQHRTRDRVKLRDAIGDYLHQIGRIPLLTSEEEITLARRIKPLIDIEAKIESLKKTLSREATEEEISQSLSFSVEELRQRIKDGRNAKNKLITANLRLVVFNAKKYTGRGLDLLDLVQEGNLGLIRATEKFKPAKGNKFSTYATYWIKQGITRAICDQSRTVRLPVHLWEKYNKLKQLIRPDHQGKKASLEAIATQLEITIDKLSLLQKKFLTPTSLDIPIQYDPSSTLLDFISEYHVNPQQKVFNQIFCEQLFDFYRNYLSVKERQVIIYRYGFFGNETYTLQEIATKNNVTRERIRQVQEKAEKIITATSKYLSQKFNPHKTICEETVKPYEKRIIEERFYKNTPLILSLVKPGKLSIDIIEANSKKASSHIIVQNNKKQVFSDANQLEEIEDCTFTHELNQQNIQNTTRESNDLIQGKLEYQVLSDSYPEKNFKCIQKFPGLKTKDIANLLAISQTALECHLNNENLRKKICESNNRYYPKQVEILEEDIVANYQAYFNQKVPHHNSNLERILRFIKHHPGITSRRLAERLFLTKKKVTHYLSDDEIFDVLVYRDSQNRWFYKK